MRTFAALLLLVAQPAWAAPIEPRDEVTEATNPATQDTLTWKIDRLHSEYQALSERVAVLEEAAAQPRQSNDKWFSIGIALLGAVTLIHALRLRRMK